MELKLPDLETHLLDLIHQIPEGKVTTYRTLAIALGDPIATRWVGSYMLNHPHSNKCPCHRVIQATGQVGHYISGSPLDKRQKLEDEGIDFYGDRIHLDYYLFETFVNEAPLVELRELQNELNQQISLNPVKSLPDRIAGVDVSYINEKEAVAAYVLVELNSGKRLWSTTVRHPSPFPYSSSYLAFREMPAHLKLIEKVRHAGKLAPVILVDGTGILHPRHAGIACHLGVLADVPTIGITKKLLCGQVNLVGMQVGQCRTVFHEEKPCGVALQSKEKVKPIYISPGYQVDMEFVKALSPKLVQGHKLPEALYWADRLSREAAKNKDDNEQLLF